MKKKFLNRVEKTIISLQSGWEMANLAWQSQPLCFLGLIFVELFQGVIPVGTAWIIKQIFDLLVQTLQSEIHIILWNQFIPLLLGQILIVIFDQTLRPVSNYLNQELSRQLSIDIQAKIFVKINSLVGLAPFENPQFHNTIQLAAQGAQMGPSQIVSMFTSFVQNTIILLSFAGILLAFDPFLALMVSLAATPQIYIQLKFGQQRFNLAMFNNPKERLTGYYNYILSSTGFAKELRLFGLADYFLQTFRQLSEEINKTKSDQQLYELRWQAVLNLISSMVASGALIFIILRAIVGAITLGSVTLYMSAVNSVQSALMGIFSSFSSLDESSLFYSQFKNLLALPQSLPISNPVHPMFHLKSKIELRNVSFRYGDENPWVLHNINLIIPAGKCLALVGLNGSGKTTLVKLLTRLYDPVEGQILWDDIDIREFAPGDLRNHIAVIFQDFIHYDLTAYANIALGDSARFNTFNLVQQSAVKADVDNLIQGLPQGYQTILSRWLAEDNRGIDLSGGEWQKIALARMFMREADLMMLDEPTAALDAQSEYDMYSRFKELIAGKTTILISHRFSTVRMADKIAVLNNGEIIEYGSHSELIELGCMYAHLYNLQAEKYL